MASQVRLMPTASKLSPEDFKFVSDLVREKSAIVLEIGKEYLVESRLTPVARALEFDSIGSLVRELRTKRDSKLIEDIVDAMTTNETLFFRDRHPFETLTEEILPDLIERKAKEKTLNIWCAASSSGQEPYSVCILLKEHFPQLRDWKVNFQTTDISPLMLERTRKGIYSQLEVNRGMPAKLMIKYFQKEGATWQIKQELRDMLQVKPLNLASAWGPMPR
ncbi:MAG: chemotaxis protein methyltransferase CheR, partial [Candidatus Paceibacteria bacterium]